VISVVLSTPKKFHFSSWLIREVTSFDSSHASIHFVGRGVLSGIPWVFEATSHGVTIVNRTVWDRSNKALHEFRMVKDEEAGEKALQEMLLLLGDDYDYYGAIHLGLHLLRHRIFGNKKKVRVLGEETEAKLFCSELVARWLVDVEQILSETIVRIPSPEETAPATLYPALKKSDVFKCAS